MKQPPINLKHVQDLYFKYQQLNDVDGMTLACEAERLINHNVKLCVMLSREATGTNMYLKHTKLPMIINELSIAFSDLEEKPSTSIEMSQWLSGTLPLVLDKHVRFECQKDEQHYTKQ